jgi:hypothetical protein
MVEFMMIMIIISKCSDGETESVAQRYVCLCLSFGHTKDFHNKYHLLPQTA